jgi:hypothetical protein
MLIRELFSNLMTEMPMHHSDLSDHALNKPAGNREYFERYIKICEPIQELGAGIILYTGDFKTGGCYMAANPRTQTIYYFMNYKRDSNRVLGRFVYQKFLWMDKAAKSVVGHLPNQYFFSLIDDYYTIATDSEQTTDGQRFWERRLRDAFEQNLNVYYYDDSSDYIEQLSNASDIELFNKKYNIYSNYESSLDKAFVISSKQLIVQNDTAGPHSVDSNVVTNSSLDSPANTAQL